MKDRAIDFFYWFLTGALVLLAGRLILLQVVEGKYYLELSEGNRVKLIVSLADRGVMYDRHGQLLVRNIPEGRDYLYTEALAHVLGFVGEISEEELLWCEEDRDCDYKAGDMVGKLGLEKEYDLNLRGIDGGILVEQDAEGKVVREIGSQEAVSGSNIELTIDLGLSKKAYQLMAGRKGALVATKPDTGEVLALVSSPGFDPSNLEMYLEDKDLALFNRVIGGEYPPGSVFKIITATAGLEEGKIDESTKVEDTGEIKVGEFRYGNWYFDQYGQKEGMLGIVRAIARSNDIFFYKTGEWLGITKLSEWAKYFGLGNETGIDIPGEANGLMPDPAWKEEYIKESWYLGDTYISAIGQGNILMTPLQVNQMTTVIAGKGKLCQPHLVKAKPNCQRLDISKKTLETVTEGLKQVTETGGTAFPFFDFKVKDKRIFVAGKTGTAEFSDIDDKTHAWFSGFAPVEGAEIVVTVLLEGAGEGSREAAPVVKDLMEYWFNRK